MQFLQGRLGRSFGLLTGPLIGHSVFPTLMPSSEKPLRTMPEAEIFTQCPVSPLSFYSQASGYQTAESLQAFVPVSCSERNGGTVNAQEVWPLLVIVWQWLFCIRRPPVEAGQWKKEGQCVRPRASEKAREGLFCGYFKGYSTS